MLLKRKAMIYLYLMLKISHWLAQVFKYHVRLESLLLLKKKQFKIKSHLVQKDKHLVDMQQFLLKTI